MNEAKVSVLHLFSIFFLPKKHPPKADRKTKKDSTNIVISVGRQHRFVDIFWFSSGILGYLWRETRCVFMTQLLNLISRFILHGKKENMTST